jgi:predicted transcriptional regulator
LLSKVEIDILKHMVESELFDPMNSRSIRNISRGIGLNYYRTRTNILHLLLLNYIQKGFKERSSNTFYITNKGVEMLSE